jgi:hypothetical protein
VRLVAVGGGGGGGRQARTGPGANGGSVRGVSMDPSSRYYPPPASLRSTAAASAGAGGMVGGSMDSLAAAPESPMLSTSARARPDLPTIYSSKAAGGDALHPIGVSHLNPQKSQPLDQRELSRTNTHLRAHRASLDTRVSAPTLPQRDLSSVHVLAGRPGDKDGGGGGSGGSPMADPRSQSRHVTINRLASSGFLTTAGGIAGSQGSLAQVSGSGGATGAPGGSQNGSTIGGAAPSGPSGGGGLSGLPISSGAFRLTRSSPANHTLIRNIVRFCKGARHPNVAIVHGYCFLAASKMGCPTAAPVTDLALVEEYSEFGTLLDLLDNRAILLETEERMAIARDIAAGMAALHRLSPPIVHGGLKPSAVLIDEKLGAKVAWRGDAVGRTGEWRR